MFEYEMEDVNVEDDIVLILNARSFNGWELVKIFEPHGDGWENVVLRILHRRPMSQGIKTELERAAP